MQHCWHAPWNVTSEFVRVVVAVGNLIAVTLGSHALVRGKALEGVPVLLARAQVFMVMLVHGVLIEGWIIGKVVGYSIFGNAKYEVASEQRVKVKVNWKTSKPFWHLISSSEFLMKV